MFAVNVLVEHVEACASRNKVRYFYFPEILISKTCQWIVLVVAIRVSIL